MSDDTKRKQEQAGETQQEDTSRALCELRVLAGPAQDVALTGLNHHGTGRLGMTYSPKGYWTARLFLPPGRHAFGVTMRPAGQATGSHGITHSHWEATFEVPALKHDTNVTPEFCIWLHDKDGC